jgi:hypothetical protein
MRIQSGFCEKRKAVIGVIGDGFRQCITQELIAAFLCHEPVSSAYRI